MADLNFNDTPSSQDASQAKPRHSQEILADLIARARLGKRRLPAMMPATDLDAAKWVARIFRAPRQSEAPRQLTRKDGSHYWTFPYADRLTYLLTKFITLDHDDQQTVIACAEDGVFWHGEPVSELMLHVDEVMAMREQGAHQYIVKLFPRMRAAISRMTDGDPDVESKPQVKPSQLNDDQYRAKGGRVPPISEHIGRKKREGLSEEAYQQNRKRQIDRARSAMDGRRS